MLREEFTPGTSTVAAEHASIEPRAAGANLGALDTPIAAINPSAAARDRR